MQPKTKGSLGLAPSMDVRLLVLCCVTLGKSLPLSELLFLSCQPPGVGRLPAFCSPRAQEAGERPCDSSDKCRLLPAPLLLAPSGL